MGKTYHSNRNPLAHVANMRRSVRFAHRNETRGGARNDQPDLLCEMDDDDFVGESYQEPADNWYDRYDED